MAIVASGALSLGTTAGTDRSISAEHGGTTPHSISEYVAVVGKTAAAGQNVAFSDFYGTSSAPTVVFGTDFSFQAPDGFSPYASRADFEVETSGDYVTYINVNSISKGAFRNDRGDWVDSKTGLTASDFEVGVTVVSGTLTGGTTTYQTLSANRNWWISLSGAGSKTTVIDVTVRQISNTSNADTIRVTLNCLNEPL